MPVVPSEQNQVGLCGGAFSCDVQPWDTLIMQQSDCVTLELHGALMILNVSIEATTGVCRTLFQ